MARSVTLLELMTRAQTRADMTVDEDGEGYITTAMWSRIIDAAYCELYDLLVASGLHYFESTQSITTDGTANVALPSDYYATIGVDASVANEWRELTRAGVRERNRFGGTGPWAAAYRIAGANLVLYPTPPTGQTYRHIYVPRPASLVDAATSTTIEGVAGWEELIVVLAAKKARIREEASVSDLIEEERALKQRITEMAELRESAAPQRIHDVQDCEQDTLEPWSWWSYR